MIVCDACGRDEAAHVPNAYCVECGATSGGTFCPGSVTSEAILCAPCSDPLARTCDECQARPGEDCHPSCTGYAATLPMMHGCALPEALRRERFAADIAARRAARNA